jgi:hypothetical protein
MNRKFLAAMAGLACAGLVFACTHTINVYEYRQDSVLDHVFIKKGVDFGAYQTIMFDEISVWHPKENGPSPERVAQVRANLAKAQEVFYQTMTAALADRYRIVQSPARNTLRVEVQFIDLRALPPDSPIPVDLQRLQFRTAPGHITMVARLFDARSGDLLARAADLGRQAIAAGEAVVDWEAIASDFDFWARIFRAWLDQAQRPA